MSGNAMFIVCEPCSKGGAADFGFKLAGRGIIGTYQPYGPAQATKQFTAWLKKHAGCAGKGKPDHFLLAHAGDRNYDQPQERLIDIVSKLPFEGAKKVN